MITHSDSLRLLTALALAPFVARAGSQTYVFGGAPAKGGAVAVHAADGYTSARGYGFEPGAVLTDVAHGGGPTACASDQAFFFSVRLPEGDYQVDLILGNPRDVTETAIRAEQRRLFFENIRVRSGEATGRRLLVNVRTPAIAGGGRISLKPREFGYANWDERLTLEFDGPHPSVEAVTITPVTPKLTVYLAGDSTVTDQAAEPWCSWGQMLPRFLDNQVVVTNLAESGETAKSFIGEHRWQKLISLIQPGDYVFLQFGHNDQKDKSPGAGAFTTYTDTLETMIAETKAHGAFPVLVTSMNRRTFDAAGKVTNSLGDFPEAVRRLAAAQGIPLIDLNAMTKTFYEALGPEVAKRAFVHFAANSFPDQDKAIADDTHYCDYGAYELAKLVVNGIRTAVPGLARHLAADVGAFSPSQPDPVDGFRLPTSPSTKSFSVPAQAK